RGRHPRRSWSSGRASTLPSYCAARAKALQQIPDITVVMPANAGIQGPQTPTSVARLPAPLSRRRPSCLLRASRTGASGVARGQRLDFGDVLARVRDVVAGQVGLVGLGLEVLGALGLGCVGLDLAAARADRYRLRRLGRVGVFLRLGQRLVEALVHLLEARL